MTPVSNKTNRELKLYYLFFTAFIFFLQFYILLFRLPFDIHTSNKKFGFFNLYVYSLTQGFQIWLPLIGFILVQLLLQVLLSIAIFMVIKEVCRFLRYQRHLLWLGLLFWLIVQFAVYLWNWFLYPHSSFSQGLNELTQNSLLYFAVKTGLFVTSTLITVAFALALYSWISRTTKKTLVFAFILIVILISMWLFHQQYHKRSIRHFKQPNIILIITDSLKPKMLKSTSMTPHISQALQQSIYFPNALTPLGRSFPALVTILTGQYPKHTGARFNLMGYDQINVSQSLTHILKKNGYETIYAADGFQFINLDSQLGYDKIIGPYDGIYDFIFSFLNDFPLANLVVNTSVGKLLFPYNYANRSSYHTYMPSSFTRLLTENLKNMQLDKPIFLTIGLSVAHAPYVWAKQPMLNSLEEQYTDAVRALDVQYGEILENLKKLNLLQHTILITLSDHGDSLGLPGDRITTAHNYIGAKERFAVISRYPYSVKVKNNSPLIGVDASTGHGTDLLSLVQLQITMALRFFNYGHFSPGIISARVSLLDVAPTMLSLLNLPQATNPDGMSLMNLLSDKNATSFFARPILLESDIEIPTIDLSKVSVTSSAIKRLIDFYSNLYTIDSKNFSLQLNPKIIQQQLSEKQRGIIWGDWLLVSFPGKNNKQTIIVKNTEELAKCYYHFPLNNSLLKSSQKYICYTIIPTAPYYVLVNLQTKKWQILYEEDAKTNPDFFQLLTKLKAFFRKELP